MDQHVSALELQSAYELRTYAVGSVLPMWCSKSMSSKICKGLASILSEGGPDQATLSILAHEGLALRAVSWKTSGSLRTHRCLMQMAGEDTSVADVARVHTVDPTLDGLRSAMFIGLVREVLGLDAVSEDEKNILMGAMLSLVCSTPPHPAMRRGEWDEGVVDMIAETRHLDGVHILIIPDADKCVMIENITPTEAGCKPGWSDADDRSRALLLIESSALLMTGIRHVSTEKDNLLIDPRTGDVSCTHDVAHQRVVIHGETPGVLDVPLQMFTLHLGIVMTAAIRIVARYSDLDRDAMILDVKSQTALFPQQEYYAKKETTRQVTARVPGRGKGSKEAKKETKSSQMSKALVDLSAFKVDCEARLTTLEEANVLASATTLKRTRSLV